MCRSVSGGGGRWSGWATSACCSWWPKASSSWSASPGGRSSRRAGLLPEIVERPDHPWFIGVQYHPELKSRPFEPHPLFKSFIHAAVEQSRLV